MKNILVVDDDKDLCDLLSEIIKEEGHNVHKAYNGFIALEKISRNNYDLLIIDNRLSGLSGISVLEQVHKSKPKLKAIMISAFGNNKTKDLARDLGVKDFVDKPFDVKQLVKKIRNTLEYSSSPELSFIY